ncbi:ketopantoate reductase family protein [Streptomyces sp. G5(2025)]|uniref:ketopantoate reductase family protein n=1 Tax=Streptomyces sp. G5(2025) TaxID=3406628 RepID=UPI003C17ED6B
MRYIIIGSGAVGGSIGGRLHESGRSVVLVARGAHFEALRANGLRLMVPTGTLTLDDVPVVARPEDVELRADDVLVLAVKTQDSVAALDAWAARPVAGGGTAGERLPLVCAQNGVVNERLALRRFREVYGVCVILPSTHLNPGEVVAPCGPYTGALVIGRYGSAVGRYGTGVDDTARRIADDLEKAHFLAPVVADVMRWKYGKLLGNLANVVEAVCGSAADAAAQDLVARSKAEGAAVLDAAGIAYASGAEITELRSGTVEPQPMPGERTRGSSWQSLARGAGSIETDYLNGELVLLGREHGVPTPVNAALQDAARQSVRQSREPGGLTAEELSGRIAAGVAG